MDWLAPLLLKLTQLGPWAPLVFILIYVAAAVALAPAFFLTVAAGAMFGVWQGSVIVFIAASIGASAVYAIGAKIVHLPWMRRITHDPRVAAVREAIAGESVWIMFLLRLSPLVPYNILNLALSLSGVRYVHFLIALVGMIPAIVMYTYYGKVVGDVAALAAGVSPPRGPEYYAMLVAGLIAIVVSTAMITRAARRAMERQQQKS